MHYLPLSDAMTSATRLSKTPDVSECGDSSIANALSGELLEHIVECDECLTGFLEEHQIACATYVSLHEAIVRNGGPTEAVVFAY